MAGAPRVYRDSTVPRTSRVAARRASRTIDVRPLASRPRGAGEGDAHSHPDDVPRGAAPRERWRAARRGKHVTTRRVAGHPSRGDPWRRPGKREIPNSEVSKEYGQSGVRTGRMVGFFKDFTRSDHPAEGRHPLSLSLPSTLLCAAWRSSVVEPEARHLAKGDPLVRRLRAPPHEGGTAMSIVVCIGCSFAC